jgi:hypothetical protein
MTAKLTIRNRRNSAWRAAGKQRARAGEGGAVEVEKPYSRIAVPADL